MEYAESSGWRNRLQRVSGMIMLALRDYQSVFECSNQARFSCMQKERSVELLQQAIIYVIKTGTAINLVPSNLFLGYSFRFPFS